MCGCKEMLAMSDDSIFATCLGLDIQQLLQLRAAGEKTIILLFAGSVVKYSIYISLVYSLAGARVYVFVREGSFSQIVLVGKFGIFTAFQINTVD